MAERNDTTKNIESTAVAVAELAAAAKEFRADTLLFMLMAPLFGKSKETDELGDKMKASNVRLSKALVAVGAE